jgi:hypothetical protein
MQSIRPEKAKNPAYMGGGAAALAKFEKSQDNGAPWATADMMEQDGTTEFKCTCQSTYMPGNNCPRHSESLYTTFASQPTPKPENLDFDSCCSEIDMRKCETDTIGFFIAKFIKTWWT